MIVGITRLSLLDGEGAYLQRHFDGADEFRLGRDEFGLGAPLISMFSMKISGVPVSMVCTMARRPSMLVLITRFKPM